MLFAITSQLEDNEQWHMIVSNAGIEDWGWRGGLKTYPGESFYFNTCWIRTFSCTVTHPSLHDKNRSTAPAHSAYWQSFGDTLAMLPASCSVGGAREDIGIEFLGRVRWVYASWTFLCTVSYSPFFHIGLLRGHWKCGLGLHIHVHCHVHALHVLTRPLRAVAARMEWCWF